LAAAQILAVAPLQEARAQGPVINEIYYLAPSGDPREEFVEIHNPSAEGINLAGWRLARGVDFAFPNVLLPPQSYLVVVPDPAWFKARRPEVQNVLGGYAGSLSNSGERLTLANQLGVEVDTVAYADGGNWSFRKKGPLDVGARGWIWDGSHDGGGRSLELIHPSLDNASGGNWKASTVEGGTPGAANSAFSTSPGLLVAEVRHSPAVPSSRDEIAISARVVPSFHPVSEVRLHYRNHTVSPPGDFQQAPMRDDGLSGDGFAGDGIYGALLPPQASGVILEFYVAAVDSSSAVRTHPAPAVDENNVAGPWANCLLQVDDAFTPDTQPLLRVVATATEWGQFKAMNRGSNAEINATVVTSDGGRVEINYLVGMRYRGATSRSLAVPSYRLEFPSDTKWRGLTDINLNTQNAFLQVLGSVLTLKSGLPTAHVRPVQVRVNGLNLAVEWAGSPFVTYGLQEVLDGDWAASHFPEDSGGNVYQARRPDTDLTYRGTNWLTYRSWGYSKNTNKPENDWSDLIGLTDVVSNASNEALIRELAKVAHVDKWATYFAVNAILGNAETSLSNGVGDDYNLYRGVSDPRFWLVPHDLDTILGFSGALEPNTSLFLAAKLATVSRFLKHKDFAPLYYRELKRLLDTTLSPEAIAREADQHLASFVPADRIATIKRYATNRAAWIRTQIPLELTISTNLPFKHGFASTNTATIALEGRANALETRSVRVNGQPAEWSAWEATWRMPQAALRPGMNRVVAQSFSTHGTLLETQTIDVWRDSGGFIPLPGQTITGEMVLTPREHPYLVEGNLIVAAGGKLRIEPGVTLFFANDKEIFVGGTLDARGTEEARIWFATPPGSPALWRGIRMYDSVGEQHLAFAVMRDVAPSSHLDIRRTTAFLDNIQFVGHHTPLIFEDASMSVKNSYFPRMVLRETVYATGMPSNGFVIFDGNYFDGTTGYSDLLEFTGGKLPGPIVQFYNNTFANGSDDGLDLDITDAYVEGNVFVNFHRDDVRESISCGIATDAGSVIHLVRNLFLNNDNGINLKNAGFMFSQNNTFIGCLEAAVVLGPLAGEGFDPARGAWIDGDVYWANKVNFQGITINSPRYPDTDLRISHSLIQGTNWPGVANIGADPRFVNPALGDYRLRDDSPAKGAGPGGLDMGAFVPGGALIKNFPDGVVATNRLVLQVGGPGMEQYAWRLDSDGEWSAPTGVTNALTLDGLAQGEHRLEVRGMNPARAWQREPPHTRHFVVDATRRSIRLNEVLARNLAATNINGIFPDLIELRNDGATPYDLAGLRLTDNPSRPDKFTFPAGAVLEPGAYLVVLAENPTGLPGFHTGFSLSQNGEGVYLYDAAARGGALIDGVSFGPQIADFSIGRLPDGGWDLCEPTFGQKNRRAAKALPGALMLSEWMASGSGPDFVEIYNTDTLPAALGGLFLTDAPAGSPRRHPVAPLSFIEAGGYFVFKADGDLAAGPEHLNFNLSAESGLIGLAGPDGALIDQVVYHSMRPNISEGRLLASGLPVARFRAPSPGAENRLNQPPQTSLAAPAPGAVFPAPSTILLRANASDPDGLVTRVEFYANGLKIGEAAAAPFQFSWLFETDIPVTLQSRAFDDAGADAFSAPVLVNQRVPALGITAPLRGALHPNILPLAVSLSLTNPPAALVKVEFFDGAASLGSTNSASGPWLLPNPTPRAYQLRAVATFANGASITSQVVPFVTLAAGAQPTPILPSSALWKYRDLPAAPPADWNGENFDDSAWAEGPAELGYGDGDEATLLSFGPDPNNKPITAYFRHAFEVGPGAPEAAFFTLRYWRDDGMVAYLNGAEILRDTMPDGPVTHETRATTSTEGSPPVTRDLALPGLRAGKNVLAVSIHQVQPASSDLSFNLELAAQTVVTAPWIIQQPLGLTVNAGSDAIFEVEAVGFSPSYRWWREGSGGAVGGNAAKFEIPFVEPHMAGAYHVTVSNYLGEVSSLPATLSVLTPDRDGDGMADYWEIRHGLDPDDAGDAAMDADGDGFSNLEEYLGGTNPRVAEFLIRGRLERQGAGGFLLVVAFQAEAGAAYAVEETPGLAPGSWTRAAPQVDAAAAGTVEVRLAPPSANRFYRVRKLE